MHAQTLHALRPLGVAGDDHAGVAVGAEVLGRIEAETAHTAETAGALALVLGAERLGSVLDEDQVVALGDVPERLHVGALAEQVDDEDGAGARRDLVLDLERVEVVGERVDVAEDGAGAGAADGAGGGEEGEGGQDDLVAGAEVQGVQGQRQGVGAGAAADAVGDAAIAGQLVLQGGDLGSEDDLSGGEDAPQGRLQLRLQVAVLGLKITEGNAARVCCHVPAPSARDSSMSERPRLPPCRRATVC